MPAPLLIIPAAGPAVAHAAATATAAASVAAPYATTLSSSTLAAVLARSLWKSLPEWVRDDPAFISFSKRKSRVSLLGAAQDSDGADAESEADEMASLASVIRKLDEMVASGSKKLGTQTKTKLKPAQLHAAVLAYVQLANQLRVRNPDARDRLYSKSAIRHGDGSVEILSKEELQELRQNLDFATWSYVDYYGPDDVRSKLEAVDYYLHSYKLSNVPGRVGHYVAISPERKIVLIGVKGTSTLEDLVTDAAGRAVGWDMHGEAESVEVTDADHETVVVTPLGQDLGGDSKDEEHINFVDDDHEEGIEVEICRGENIMITSDGATVRCHEGVLLCARRLADEVRDVVQTLAARSEYSVLIVGHSLGAGVGIILANLLRSALPILAERDAVRVYAFAPPPVLDVDGAIGCAPFVTSVVNNADVIPRGSVANLAVLLELLTVIDGKLEKLGMGLGGPKRAAALLRKLMQGTGGDMLMEWQEVRDLVDETHRRVDLRDPDHLYVPGRVLLMYDPWAERGSSINGVSTRSSISQRGDDSNSSSKKTEPSADAEGEFVKEELAVRTDGAVRCAVTYGTAAPLRLFEVDALRMVTDHLTTSHEAGIDCLLSRS